MRKNIRLKVWRLLVSGMGGAMFISVIQLSTRDSLNGAHKTAVICFALALPIMVNQLIYWWLPPNEPGIERPKFAGAWQAFIMLVGMISCTVGMAALFFSFGWWAAVAFMAGIIGIAKDIEDG